MKITLSLLVATLATAIAGSDVTQPFPTTEPFAKNLTGDWGGLRSDLADRGFTVGLESTHFYQGLESGDGDPSYDYSGRVDARLALDTDKFGLWQGGSFHSHLEYRYGDLSAFRSRGLMATNLATALPFGAAEEIEMSSLYLRQYLSQKSMIMLGRINTIDLLESDPFFGGYGITRFMNLGLVAPPTGVTPPVIVGGLYSIRTGPLAWTLMAYDPNDRTQDYWPRDAFEDGINLSLTSTWNGKLAGRKTTVSLGGIYSTKNSGDLSEFLVPDELRTGRKDYSWHTSLNFGHLLYEIPDSNGKGIGIYFKTAVADGNPNPIQGYFSGGFTGTGIIPNRPEDSIGIGYYYYNFSDDLQTAVAPIIKFKNEEGIELFYNCAVTPWFNLTADIQIIDPARAANDTAVIAGLRGNIRF